VKIAKCQAQPTGKDGVGNSEEKETRAESVEGEWRVRVREEGSIILTAKGGKGRLESRERAAGGDDEKRERVRGESGRRTEKAKRGGIEEQAADAIEVMNGRFGGGSKDTLFVS